MNDAHGNVAHHFGGGRFEWSDNKCHQIGGHNHGVSKPDTRGVIAYCLAANLAAI